MSRDSFYVTLLSNASLDTCPNNKPGNFVNIFDHAKRLIGDWEVGLKQIQFTHKWTNKTGKFSFVAWYSRPLENVRVTFANPGPTITEETRKLTKLDGLYADWQAYDWVQLESPGGEWKDYKEFGQHLAGLIGSALRSRHGRAINDVTFFRDDVRHTSDFVISGAKGTIAISTFQPEYMKILGIAETQASLSDPTVKAFLFDRTVETALPASQSTTVGFTDPETIFVYCDACEEQIMADKQGSILQLVPVTSKRNYRQCIDYDSPAYVRVKPIQHLTSVKIQIADIDGNIVPFELSDSFTTLRLHFRRCEVDWY